MHDEFDDVADKGDDTLELNEDGEVEADDSTEEDPDKMEGFHSVDEEESY